MANWVGWVTQVALALCLYIIALESVVEGRGGRGGARGGRYGRVGRSGSRVGGMSSTRKAILAGTIFGAASYRRRRRYISDPDSDPSVCKNDQYVGNGTVYYYGQFICPTGEQDDDYNYCCGAEGSQYCCKFFDDAGRTAGVVIGVIIFAVIVVLVIFCICKSLMKNRGGMFKGSGSRGHTNNAYSGNTAYSAGSAMTYSAQNGGDGFVHLSAPPPYEATQSDAGYKQPLPNGDYSSNGGPTPYPANPTPYPANPTSYPAAPDPYSQPYAPYPGGDQGFGYSTQYSAQPYPSKETQIN